jgi:hypothetical protein
MDVISKRNMLFLPGKELPGGPVKEYWKPSHFLIGLLGYRST